MSAEDHPEAHGDAWFCRRFAAIALDHAARDPALQGAVRRTLKHWRSSAEPALRCTAAIALGYDIGHADLESTLDELRVLGTPQESTDLSSIEEGPLADDWP